MSVFRKLTTHQLDDTQTSRVIRQLLYQHKDYLNGLSSTVDIAVEIGAARPYERNLFGYLVFMDIPPRMHWPIMILSKLASPAEFHSGIGSLRRPSLTEIDNILSIAGV